MVHLLPFIYMYTCFCIFIYKQFVQLERIILYSQSMHSTIIINNISTQPQFVEISHSKHNTRVYICLYIYLYICICRHFVQLERITVRLSTSQSTISINNISTQPQFLEILHSIHNSIQYINTKAVSYLDSQMYLAKFKYQQRRALVLLKYAYMHVLANVYIMLVNVYLFI